MKMLFGSGQGLGCIPAHLSHSFWNRTDARETEQLAARGKDEVAARGDGDGAAAQHGHHCDGDHNCILFPLLGGNRALLSRPRVSCSGFVIWTSSAMWVHDMRAFLVLIYC